jgi:hypothetical protein
MLSELAPRRTPLSIESVANALIVASDGGIPRAGVRVVTAQIGVETGGYAGCLNFNLAGAKTNPNNGRTCWQFFATTERFTAAELARAQQAAVGTGAVRIDGEVSGMTKVTLFPKHPWCCFRAFETLEAAITDHLTMLRDKFPCGYAALVGSPAAFEAGLALAARKPKDASALVESLRDRILAGDPEAFAVGLSYGVHGGYYTATQQAYADGLRSRLREIDKKLAPSWWGDLV